MLVLSRKNDESIVFINGSGEVVGEVKVVYINSDSVRLGCVLDSRVKILREELLTSEQTIDLDRIRSIDDAQKRDPRKPRHKIIHMNAD